MSAYKNHYREHIVESLHKQFKYTNKMQAPKIVKVTINIGGKSGDNKSLEKAREEMSLIAGQKAVITKTRKSEAGFKIRKGWDIGCRVTLRNDQMYLFLERLVQLALPLVRDFRGLNPKAFDGRGNFNMGIKEHIVFPEIKFDEVDVVRGMNISITTTATTDEEALFLLKQFGFPFKEEK